MAFKRKKLNLAKVTQKAKEGGKTGGISYIKESRKRYVLHAKKNHLSIIPFEVTVPNNLDGIDVGDVWFKASVMVHPQIGVNKQMVICPKMFNHRCPICDAEAELAEQGYEWNSKERNSLRAKRRELYNVIDMDKPEDGMQLLEVSYNIFGKKLDAEIEDDEAVAGFADPDEGLIVVARGKEETFGSHKYIDVDKITFEDRDPLTDEELEKALDLHAILDVKSYDELVNLFNGEEDEALKPKSKSSHASSEDDEEEDDEEEEETPRRRHHQEEEEESEEDEEEEETPKPRRKSLKKKKSDDDDDFPWNDDQESEPALSNETSESEDESDEDSDDDSDECSHFGDCGFDDDKCDDCDNWSACRKETDRRLKAKRSK